MLNGRTDHCSGKDEKTVEVFVMLMNILSNIAFTVTLQTRLRKVMHYASAVSNMGSENSGSFEAKIFSIVKKILPFPRELFLCSKPFCTNSFVAVESVWYNYTGTGSRIRQNIGMCNHSHFFRINAVTIFPAERRNLDSQASVTKAHIGVALLQ